MDWCGITCSSLPTLICIKTIKSWAAGASCFVPALLDTLSPEQRGCVWDNPRTVPVSRRPRLGELSDPQAPYGAPLLLLQLEEALGSEGRGCWVSGAGQGWAEGASGPLWCSVLHQRCLRGVAAVTDPLKSPSCWTEGVHLYLMALCQSWSFHCSTFGSVMCMQGGEAGEEQEQHFNIQGTAPDLQVWSVIVLKGLFFKIDITFWFPISTLWNFVFHNAQTAFNFSDGAVVTSWVWNFQTWKWDFYQAGVWDTWVGK